MYWPCVLALPDADPYILKGRVILSATTSFTFSPVLFCPPPSVNCLLKAPVSALSLSVYLADLNKEHIISLLRLDVKLHHLRKERHR